MKKTLVLTMLACCAGLFATADLKLTANPKTLQVENNGDVYTFNTFIRGSWGKLLTFGKAAPDAVTLALRTGAGVVHPQAVPADIKVLTKTPEKIVILGSYKLAIAGKADLPEKNLSLVIRYTFIKGMPGFSAVGKLSTTTETPLQMFSVNAGSKYETFSVKGGAPQKNTADWKLLKGVNSKNPEGIAAFKKDRRMFFYAPLNSTSGGGFYIPVVTAWHKLTLKAGEGKDFRFAVSLGATKEQDETLVSFCKGEKNIELPGTEKESSTASVRSPFLKPTKITAQFI